MKNDLFKFALLACLSLIGLASCQESDDTPEEFPDWQNKNEQAFLKIYKDAQDSIAAGKKWIIARGMNRADYSDDPEKPEDFVVIQVLEDGPGREVPYATDTVLVHYQGVLQPSTHVPQGLVFDSSYKDRYDEGVSSPYKGRVGGFVEGFATALQHMNRGDYWKIYIPYQLAYKGNATGNIPAYSMLTFYVKLDDFWSKKEGDRPEKIY